MNDIKISELEETTYLKGGCCFPLVQESETKKVSFETLKNELPQTEVMVGTTTTGESGTEANVFNSGTASAPILNFTIPKGEKGEQGIQGPRGPRGFKGDTVHDVYIGDKSAAPIDARLIIEPVKGSANGSNIQITDSANDNIPKLVLDGRSTQETRSGKNLLEPITTATNSGITCTNNGDGSYTLNGTATGTVMFYIDIDCPAGTYTLSANNETTNSNSAFYIWAHCSGDSIRVPFTSLNAKTTKTITNPITGWSIVVDGGLTLNNFTIKPMLEKGSTATTFEQFGASPTPDYPSEIKSVKSESLFDINYTYKVGDTITYKGVTITFDENGYITLNGTVETNGDLNIVAQAYTITLDKDIYLLFDLLSGSVTNTSRGVNVQAINKSGASIWSYGASANTPIVKVPYSEIASIKWIRVQLVSGVSYNNYKFRFWVSTKNSLNYKPFNAIQVKVAEKNLFNTVFEQNARNNTDGKTTVYSTNYIRTKNPIQVEPNITYTIKSVTSKKTSGGDIHYYDKNMNFIGRDGIVLESVKTMPNGCYYINFQYYSGAGIVPEDIKTTQIEKGSIATAYKPYQENVSNIDLQGNELCSIGDVKDELVVENGKAKIIKRIGKVVLNGSENWQAFTNITPQTYYVDNLISAISDATTKNYYSNYFNAITTSERYIDKSFFINYLSRLTISYNDMPTISDFKSWLSAHNTEVYYILAEPYEIDLGKITPPATYEGITNITNSDDTNMNVNYITDKTNLYYQNNRNIIKINN